ncbi:hypothetical protein COV15_02830 [Candidatus Woesearchaeota archaeon CG10_big_fil_rev_8_21_14_0_10_34_12]|nr:MAG: hypothetical protein COV15_02830 [Candidatus Woesearchaeota archaeon CG10_big_fil_rev_8_21_14_0_10_34_12]
MIIELIIALIVGVIAGTFTGLIPGVHINLVIVFLSSVVGYNLNIPTIVLTAFVVSLSITHNFLDFIPGIFLGCPDEDSALSVLPGHQMLKEGKGYEAVIHSLKGCLTGLVLAVLITPVFIFILPKVYRIISSYMFLILSIISLFLIISDKNKFLAFLIFMFSGFLGVASMNLPIQQPLLPLLTGLFGCSTLITSISKKIEIPKQEISKPEPKKNIRTTLASIFVSPLCSFLPGLGSNQAAIISCEFLKKIEKQDFLFLIGSINIITMSLSFVTLYAIDKARTGSAVFIGQLTPLSPKLLLVILSVVLISGILASFSTLFFAKLFAKNITKFSYTKISAAILIFIFIIVLIISKPLGILVLISSTLLGITAIQLNVRRTQLMGCLILPAIFFVF